MIIKARIMKEVIVEGKSYPIDDKYIVQDCISKEYILRERSVNIFSLINLNANGFDGEGIPFVIDGRNIDRYLREGSAKILVTRHGDYYILSKCRVSGQAGRIFPSVNPDTPYLVYDNFTHPRQNIANKFRSFDNLVRKFKDIDNKLIPQEDKKLLIQRNFEYGVDSSTFKILGGYEYTFGVELETNSGRLSNDDVIGLNLKCEFDGSLRDTPDQRKEDVLGGEYITGVLKGDSGMYQLQKICNKLSEKCTINNKCGVHVHIGGIKFNKENIVYMYMLGEMLQNEVYQMLPASRRNNAYCKKLKNLSLNPKSLSSVNTAIGYEILIDDYYTKVFREVSHGKMPDRNVNKRTNHPMGSKCGYNKDTQRYCWLNFVTAMFNTKNNPEAMTLEFRSHSATLNYSKVKAWVKICMAFVSFVENNKASIKRGYWLDSDKNEYPIDLSTIVKAAYPKGYKLLTKYIEERKNKFFYDKGDIEEEEYKTDKNGIKQLSIKEDILCV